MPHDLLIAKLHAHGLDENALVLLLETAETVCENQKTNSSFQTILSRVPQGPVLGPLLVDVYINDLFLFSKQATLHDYADDITLGYLSKTLSHLNGVLEKESGLGTKLNDCQLRKVQCTPH